MKQYLHTVDNLIVGNFFTSDEQVDASNGISVSAYFDASSVFGKGYVDGEFVERPTESHTWKKDHWAIDMEMLRGIKWTQIKQYRSQAEYAGFTWGGSTFDSDATSQNRITGAVTLATLSSAFTIDWILADNTVRTLTQMDMIQVGGALGQHVAAQFSKGALLREAIEVATTPAEVEAVVW